MPTMDKVLHNRKLRKQLRNGIFNWKNLVKRLSYYYGAFETSSHDFLQYTDDVFVSKIDNLFDTEPSNSLGPTDPANNAVNVPLNKIIKLVFNEQIQA